MIVRQARKQSPRYFVSIKWTSCFLLRDEIIVINEKRIASRIKEGNLYVALLKKSVHIKIKTLVHYQEKPLLTEERKFCTIGGGGISSLTPPLQAHTRRLLEYERTTKIFYGNNHHANYQYQAVDTEATLPRKFENEQAKTCVDPRNLNMNKLDHP